MAFIWTRMWQLGEGTPILGGEHVNKQHEKKTLHIPPPPKKKKHKKMPSHLQGKNTNTTSNQLTEVQILDWPDGRSEAIVSWIFQPRNCIKHCVEKIKMMEISAGQGYLI